MDVQEEMKQLRDELNENAHRYYVLDEPTMSDYDYDMKNRRLQQLELEHPEEITPDSPTQRVGDRLKQGFETYRHEVPLESLQDVFSAAEVEDFCRRMTEALGDQAVYSVEPKVDGLSVALEYRDGVFFKGATRGDGQVGEDVTENLRTIRSIPMKLPEKLPRLIVRGEVYMARTVFEEINQQREIDGQPLLANPRNAAAGSLRQLDPKIAAQRRLDIQVFNLQLAQGGRTFATHSETLDYLESQHFKVISHRMLASAADCAQEIVDINERRMRYPYDMDGAVIKIDRLDQREELGSTVKCPKWAIAYKYPPEQKPSQVLDIVVQVGRTGVVTPKAILAPVHLAGTTVQSATLHNQDFIAEKDIRVGDTVLVQKAGEIIPEIVEVDVSKRPAGTVPYLLPTVCPVCGAAVTRDVDGVALRCTGAECPAQLLRNITHFASRDAMDIDGLGPAVIQQLIETGLIHSAADLYTLREQDLAQLERMGAKSAANAVAAIEKSKSNDFGKLLYALGIRQVGEKAGKVLAAHFKSFDALELATLEELTEIDDVGAITARFLLDWLASPQSKDLMEKLRLAGVRLDSASQVVDNRFAGQTFVLTGTLTKLDRKSAEASIEARGGKASGSVSKKTTYVVAGEAAGSKLTKARELNIPVLSEEEFSRLLEQGKAPLEA